MARRHDLRSCGRLLCSRADNRFFICHWQSLSPALIPDVILVLCLACCCHDLPGCSWDMAYKICDCADLFSFSPSTFGTDLLYKSSCWLGSDSGPLAPDKLCRPGRSIGIPQPENPRSGAIGAHLHDYRCDGFGHPAYFPGSVFWITGYCRLHHIWSDRLADPSMDRGLV